MANNQNLGRLPTLGLNTLKAEDFGDDSRNPFYVQPNTEKMLVVRELEREFKDLNKFEKDALRIFDKQISTRLDRCGAIREVGAIPASKEIGGAKKNIVALQGQSTDDLNNAANKQKLNIFDTQDSNVLKTETLARLGHDERALVPVDNESQGSSVYSSQMSIQKPKTIEYLNKGRQQKETVRDFIDNAR